MAWDANDLQVTTFFLNINLVFYRGSPTAYVFPMWFTVYTQRQQGPNCKWEKLCCIRVNLAINECCQNHLAQILQGNFMDAFAESSEHSTTFQASFLM